MVSSRSQKLAERDGPINSAKQERDKASVSKAAAFEGFVLVPGQRQRLGDQLYGQILDLLLSGRLKEGDRLPSEHKISKMFGVSRPIVRDALMRLRVDGLLQVRQGSGTYVMHRPVERLKSFASSEDVSRYLRCLEVRAPLEAAAARLAAQRRSDADLTNIVEAHERFKSSFELNEAHYRTDMAFHSAIAAASANEFFQQALDQLGDTLELFMSLSLNLTRTGTRARAQKVIEEHGHIVEAIQTQDADAADVAMRFHIGQALRRMIDRDRDI